MRGGESGALRGIVMSFRDHGYATECVVGLIVIPSPLRLSIERAGSVKNSPSCLSSMHLPQYAFTQYAFTQYAFTYVRA